MHWKSDVRTDITSSAALSEKTVNLFSDLLVHHMGSGLADDIVQGAAGPDEFRTAPPCRPPRKSSRPPESLQKPRYATSGTRGTEPPYLRYLA